MKTYLFCVWGVGLGVYTSQQPVWKSEDNFGKSILFTMWSSGITHSVMKASSFTAELSCCPAFVCLFLFNGSYFFGYYTLLIYCQTATLSEASLPFAPVGAVKHPEHPALSVTHSLDCYAILKLSFTKNLWAWTKCSDSFLECTVSGLKVRDSASHSWVGWGHLPCLKPLDLAGGPCYRL